MASVVDLGADLARGGEGGGWWYSRRLFEVGGVVEGDRGGGWLHAGSQAFHVCMPALKCHLEERADGREAGRAGAMKGVALLALPDTAL